MTSFKSATDILSVFLLAFWSVLACASPYEYERPGEDRVSSLQPARGFRLTRAEKELYDLVMAHRAEHGLPRIPISPGLTKVARTHVRDLNTNRPHGGKCNAHSWSNKGDWTPCCYTKDHKRAKCMWHKPRELSSYKGFGYEIAMQSSAPLTPRGALRGWQGSSAHHAVMLNRGIWKTHWRAIGIGIEDRHAVIWFGREPETR